MKRLMMVALAALFSLSIASISLAQEGGAAGGQPAGESTKPAKKSKKHHGKKHKKGKKTPGPAEGSGK